MRSITVAIIFSLLATVAVADSIRFDPPNPTARTPVTAHLIGNFSACTSPAVTRNGRIISIKLGSCTLPLQPPVVDLPVDLGVVEAGVYDVVAGFPGILIGLAEGTLIVQDAAPPFQVTPNVAPFGVEVKLSGHDLILCAGGSCTTPGVKFGDVLAPQISATADRIVVHAPQHDAGPVDVTIDRGGSVLRATATFYYVPSNRSPDPAFYEPVLFPVAFNGAGAFGTLWNTDIQLRNENDYAVATWPLSAFNLGCGTGMFECNTLIDPHSTRTTGANVSNGFVVYLPRQAAPAVHFGLLVKDLRRQSEALGTEIPVVREKDFFGHPLELLNVPTDSRFRVTLRVYQLGTPASIGLIIQPMGSEETLLSTFVFPAGTPPYVQISDLVATYPQLAGKGPLRIQLTPAVSGNPTLWAFASVTNNETQHVTTISPQ
ncbi:MAG TPA: IPT/TIG domain-containing protein [Thermoanaerobaculia bacterium]|nr:IPT/TIG domain-containing protein [Thermoanaerobaculia bacterium]